VVHCLGGLNGSWAFVPHVCDVPKTLCCLDLLRTSLPNPQPQLYRMFPHPHANFRKSISTSASTNTAVSAIARRNLTYSAPLVSSAAVTGGTTPSIKPTHLREGRVQQHTVCTSLKSQNGARSPHTHASFVSTTLPPHIPISNTLSVVVNICCGDLPNTWPWTV
jgi:hypothetical protein